MSLLLLLGASSSVAVNRTGLKKTPSEIAGYLFHLTSNSYAYQERTGASATTAAEGGPLGSWKEKVQNLWYTAASDGVRPQQTSNGVHFKGTGDARSVVNTASAQFSLSKNLTIVAMLDGTGMPISSQSGFQIYYLNDTVYVGVDGGGAWTYSNTNVPVEPHILSVVYDSALASANRIKIWINGVQMATTTTATIATATAASKGVRIGDAYGLGVPFTGNLGEIIAFDSSLSENDRRSVEEYIADRKIYGSRSRNIVLGPRALDKKAMVVYIHGSGVDETYLPLFTSHAVVNPAIRDAGYAIASANYNGEHWGNEFGLVSLRKFCDWLQSEFSPTRLILWGESMGGILAQKAIVDSRFTDIKGAYLTYPVCSLSNMDYGAFSANIALAYPSGYTGQSATDLAGSLFTGKRLRYTHSPTDGVVDQAANTDAMRTKVAAYATEYGLVVTSGIHGDISNFDAADMIAFFDRCV